MNIMQLCLSNGFGGLELYVAKLDLTLRAQGHRCVSVAAPGTRLAGWLEQQQTRPLYLSRKSRALPIFAAKRLARWIDEYQIDVLQMHWGYDLALAVFAKRFARRPVHLIYMRHMDLPHDKHDPWHAFLYGHVDTLLAITREMQQQMHARIPIPATRVRQLYLGAPKPVAHAECARFIDEAALEPAAFKIGLIGRVEPAKGQHLLVQAVSLLRARGLNAQAAIIGHAAEARHERALHAQIEALGLQAHVKRIGHLPNAVQRMACFDVVVLATRKETFGLVLVEAMRAGTAVVASNAGGAREIVEHEVSGLLFTPEDAHALAECLWRLGDDPALRARLAAAGRMRAESMFAEESHFAQMDALLISLAETAAAA